MQLLLFYLFAMLAVIFAVAMIVARKPVSSAISLVGVMFCLAVFYALLDAHLIAALQILVYAGAIMVLFLFVIMLLDLRQKEGLVSYHRAALQFVGVGIFSGLLVPFMAAVSMTKSPVDAGAAKEFGTTAGVGELLYTDFILPFEITSVLLLVALVGAVALTKIKMR